MLLRSGELRVRVADLPHAIILDRDDEEGILGFALREAQVVYVSADLRDKAQVVKERKSCDVKNCYTELHASCFRITADNFFCHRDASFIKEGHKRFPSGQTSCK